VHIDGGRRDVGVAEQDSHDARIDTAFQKSRRITMPQRMRADRPCDARSANTETEGAPQRILADRPGAEAIRAEPTRVAVGQPNATQVIEHWLRQRHAALLVTLADDPKQQSGAVNASDFHGCGLADAQATGIHEREASSMDGVPYAAKECADLSVRKYGGQTLLPGRPDSFFENSGQSRLSVL